jgi:proteasome accessory factor B
LAADLEVSRRTVFRDLNMLEMARIPYYFDPDGGGYRISRHFFLPPINLTLGESLAIMVLAGRARGGARLPLMAQVASAAMKVEGALPQSIRDHVGSVVDALEVRPSPVSGHAGLDATFEDLARAVAGRIVCRLVYISFHERGQIITTVQPLRLVFVNRAWYLIAWSARHGERRTFKLGRIRKLTVTDRTFTPPSGAVPEEPFGAAWCMIPEGKLYDVHLHFDPRVAGNVAEVHWHPSQQVEWNDDGSVEFHARVDGLGEISWWILGYGDQVEVLAPPALRLRVGEVAARVAARHQAEGPRP